MGCYCLLSGWLSQRSGRQALALDIGIGDDTVGKVLT